MDPTELLLVPRIAAPTFLRVVMFVIVIPPIAWGLVLSLWRLSHTRLVGGVPWIRITPTHLQYLGVFSVPLAAIAAIDARRFVADRNWVYQTALFLAVDAPGSYLCDTGGFDGGYYRLMCYSTRWRSKSFLLTDWRLGSKRIPAWPEPSARALMLPIAGLDTRVRNVAAQIGAAVAQADKVATL